MSQILHKCNCHTVNMLSEKDLCNPAQTSPGNTRSALPAGKPGLRKPVFWQGHKVSYRRRRCRRKKRRNRKYQTGSWNWVSENWNMERSNSKKPRENRASMQRNGALWMWHSGISRDSLDRSGRRIERRRSDMVRRRKETIGVEWGFCSANEQKIHC